MAAKKGGGSKGSLPQRSKKRYSKKKYSGIPGKANKKRYERIPGKARRYYDTVDKKSISWYEWDKRTGGQVPSVTRRARAKGYRTRYQREKGIKHALGAGNVYTFAVPETVEARKSRERSLRTRARQRAEARQRDLARTWWLKQHGPSVPLDMNAALSDPNFQYLTERLRALEAEEATHTHLHGTDDPFYSPYGEYALALEMLGRRPESFPYEPGDSPTGTVYYMNYPEPQSSAYPTSNR